ncbi:MAG: cytochrome c biogenesis protein CcsA [Pirellulales bacterium]|nr:cytochrome c biogenesis protein CcsA [Pirellulales bacterium]
MTFTLLYINRLLCVTLIGLLFQGVVWAGDSIGFDWAAWRGLPVQEGGRYKPLDTLARETVRTLCDRASFVDRRTGRKLTATEFYLTLLLTGKAESRPKSPAEDFFRIPKPDEWDKTPLLYVDSRPLRRSLGLPAGAKSITPWALSRTVFHDPASGRKIPFLDEVRELIARQQLRQPLTPEEQEVLRLADALGTYLELRRGQQLRLVPLPGGALRQWMSVSRLLRTEFTDADDPSGRLRKAQTEFRRIQAAFQSQNATDFNSASAALFGVLEELGGQVKDYPSATVIALEVDYNRLTPFRIAWILTGGAFVLSLAAGVSGRRLFYYAAWIVFCAALAVMLAGFAMRAAITGWAPVTNMYETVIYLALGTAVFGLIFEYYSPRRYVLTAAAAVSTFALILADHSPVVLDASIRPLMPVLKNNYWLTIHVMSIMLGYAAFALAWALGNVTMDRFLFYRSKRGFYHDPEAVAALNRITHRTLQIGVFLLTLGTILGAVWAEYAWGRFWGWDPKEVWALITLLLYLALLHARRIGWVGSFGLAAGSAFCFLLIVWAWYGVNFVMGTGLHSYGFGGGGQQYVYAAFAVQLFYLAAAIFRARLQPRTRPDYNPLQGEKP